MTTPEALSKAPAPALLERARAFASSLAGRLLALVAVGVLGIEALVFAYTLGDFHAAWVQDRVNLAQVAALARGVAPDAEIGEEIEFQLLTNAAVQRVALIRGGERELILEGAAAISPARIVTYDYSNSNRWRRFAWAAQTFFAPGGRVLRIVARPRYEDNDLIEIVLNEAPLKRDMGAFARNFAFASTLILLAAAALVYVTLSYTFVRPMLALTRSIERFRDKPEDVSVAFARSNRADEIGRAERAAADMADQVRAALRQKERLAALGAAVARIGHDLRNMLTTAQLVADRLAKSEDPAVRQVAPRLERAIDRAAKLAASTLKYGRADERAPALRKVALAEAAGEAAADALIGFAAVSYRPDIEPGLACMADPEHLHRILTNLMKNAAQAMEAHERRDKLLTVRATGAEGRCEIEIIDHGPGLREGVLARLFDPFVTGDAERGGAGLGLAISRELARAMGGELALTRTGAEGATFLLLLAPA